MEIKDLIQLLTDMKGVGNSSHDDYTAGLRRGFEIGIDLCIDYLKLM